jgi:cell division septation protein DedD
MRAARLSAALAAATMAQDAGGALAQIGAGAESYEVTISPPKRPGSAPVADGEAPASDATGEPRASVPAGDGAAGTPASAAPAANAPAAGTATPAASVARAAPVAKPSGPPRTLQVAAFRQHDRAESLRDELAESFPDVAILEVSSGGEPLYRVNVGRLPKGAGLDELKKRLAAAGFPSFDVAAPTAPAND